MSNWLWFEENFEIEKGRRVKIAVKEILEVRQSLYQKIEVYDTIAFGKMLVLDGVIMITEFDNFAYHEMIAHIPLIAHNNPRKVLIVGGGDGGTLTEVLKHPEVEEVVLCEIDADVINVCKKYFPEFAEGFNDKRLKLIIDDAAKYITNKPGYFDVICVDSSDPFGPAEILFQEKFFHDIHNALKDDGIAVFQSESIFYHTDFIASLCMKNRKIFQIVSYYFTMIPTYPSGTIGFSFCSKKYNPFENINKERIRKIAKLRYYSEEIHKSCFILPKFIEMKLE